MAQARRQLVAADVLAYEKPLCQVLALENPKPVVVAERRANQPLSVGQILQRILTPGGAA